METDLVPLLRFTGAAQDTTEVDLGGPQAAPYLRDGWSAPEIAPSGESVARAVKRAAALQVTVLEPSDRVLTVRCVGLHLPRRRPPAVAVRVNGRRLGFFSPTPDMAEHRMTLPARLLQRGPNEIAFAGRLGRGEERLDVAYDTIHIVDPAADMRAAPRADGDAVVLPSASAATYFLRLPQRPTLHFGLAADDGASSVALRMQPDGAAERTLFSGAAPRAAADVSLDAFAGQIVRLTLQNDGPGAVRALAPRLRGVEPAPEPPHSAGRPDARNVILYVIDTLRADHLGCYGYPRPTSPQIDEFARHATLFERAIAQSSWTRPAAASILTGRYSAEHGANTLRRGLRPGVATLAEALAAHGYRTAAFVTNINVAPQWGFQRGFEVYRYLAEDERSPTVHVGADVVNAQALDWLAAGSDRPYFLYVHATDPHAPYRPPSPWAERFVDPSDDVPPAQVDTLLGDIREHGVQPTADEVRALMARYDGEIAFTDSQFGRFVTELRRRGLLERTLIVLVADHGEEFGDHGGFEHGRTLYEEMLHVPLIVRLPNPEGAGRRVAESVRQIDIAPTVLEYVGVQVPGDLPGRSLLGALSGAAQPPVDALADTGLGRQRVAAVMTGDWKVIDEKVGSSAKTQVYNVSQDERERADLAEQHPVLVGYARQALAAAVAGGSPPPADNAVEPVVDPAILERLRALGYRH